jgi:nitroreductase
MDIKDLLIKNRSYRRFDEGYKIFLSQLKELVDLTRYGASARNAQPLKYYLSCSEDSNNIIFPNLQWAAFLKDWDGPAKGERPTAYIIILLDKNISKVPECDYGIAAQNILLGAVEKGLGGCIIKSILRENLRKELEIPDHLDILLTIALGKPIEKVVIEPMPINGDYKYWRDQEGIHHVPKRSLDEIIWKK